MTKTLNIHVQITPELEAAMDKLTIVSGQSINLITEDALKHYVAWRAPQLADLQEAIAAADRGEFAAEAEVNAVFSRYDA